MTTAHRPTWKAAVATGSDTGRWSAGGALSTLRSSKDGASHKTLKYLSSRQLSVGGDDQQRQIEESLRKVQEAERQVKEGGKRALKQLLDGHQSDAIKPEVEERGESRARAQEKEVDVGLLSKYDDADDDEDEDEDGDQSDAGSNDDDDGDAKGSDAGSDSSSDSDSDSSDSDDEEALLQAELSKIRRERDLQKERDLQAQRGAEDAQRAEAALLGNPLLQGAGGGGGGGGGESGKLKRRWNDDVVFRNQARNEPEQNKKRFINDTVRNDFHKRFLNKYVN